jgi:hypothetical protein
MYMTYAAVVRAMVNRWDESPYLIGTDLYADPGYMVVVGAEGLAFVTVADGARLAETYHLPVRRNLD